MLKTTYDTLKETTYFEVLPNGLTVYLIPKPGYAKTYAMFSTRYGSIDNHFNIEGQPEIKVVDGIAHFLEHKLFEEPEGDVFMKFATQGASANAFTSHTRTSYLFSATGEVEKNLTTLLDFVQRPYLTDANVEKEKGIIEQEIRMYEDQAFWRGYRQLLENLFHQHPVRIDIAGTIESIYQINVDNLMKCYKTFYHPTNMVLVVVGDFDAERIMTLVRDNQAAKDFGSQAAIERHFEAEPATIANRRSELKLSIAKPLCMIGFKEREVGLTGHDLIRRDLTTRILMDTVFGKSSDLYQELDDAGLIDPSFGYDYESNAGFSFAYVGGETEAPDQLIERIRDGIERIKRQGISQAAFNRARNRKIGEFLRVFNSPEHLSYEFTQYLFEEADLFQVPTLMEGITVADGQLRFEELFHPDVMTVSLVTPVESKTAASV
ncbi:MAG TPA: pitrilysin family protein [Stenomitos sp.]